MKYVTFSPSKSYPYHGEIPFDLRNLEDKNILKLQEDELKGILQTPGNQNKILFVSRIYPRKIITSEDDLKEFLSMQH